MTEKNTMIQTLGESKLLLPRQITDGLQANDQVKYFFTLLQTISDIAQDHGAVLTDLREERVAAGVESVHFDSVIGDAELQAADFIFLPYAEEIRLQITHCLERMLAPIQMAHDMGLDAPVVDTFENRLIQLQAKTVAENSTGFTLEQIKWITSGNRDAGDSWHLLVMDLHKVLNQLQVQIAERDIAGAKVYEIDPSDEAFVKAFMAGIARTRELKFDHPGLGTTATRQGEKLVIQNDIGTTDAHVLVINVFTNRVTITYTDVHLERLLFFQSLFSRFNVDWGDTLAKRDKKFEDGVYHLSVGTFSFTNDEQCQQYLQFSASRLVFLIDWNRARKRLRPFLSKPDRIRLLQWAADHDYGHMAFLKLGGDRLLLALVEQVNAGILHAGEALHEIAGNEATLQFMKYVLRTCSEGLRRQLSESHIRDEIRAELQKLIRSAQKQLTDMAVDHASYLVEMASTVQECVLLQTQGGNNEQLKRIADKVKQWERRADKLLSDARETRTVEQHGEFYRHIIEQADDIADEIEDAVFRLTVKPLALSAESATILDKMSARLAEGTRHLLRLILLMTDIQQTSHQQDVTDFLQLVYEVINVEHDIDEAFRALELNLLSQQVDCREFYVLIEAAKNIEQASDVAAHIAHALREHAFHHLG